MTDSGSSRRTARVVALDKQNERFCNETVVIYFCNSIICARANRSEDDKVAAMLPRYNPGWAGDGLENLALTHPSVGGNPCDDEMKRRLGGGDYSGENECLIAMSS